MPFDEHAREQEWRRRLEAMYRGSGGDIWRLIRDVAVSLTLRDKDIAEYRERDAEDLREKRAMKRRMF